MPEAIKRLYLLGTETLSYIFLLFYQCSYVLCISGVLTSMDLTGLLGLFSLLLLIISMSSPYWLTSWADTNSPFVRLGPWEACFNRFRFPRFQFDRVFHGCHPVWGSEYRLIREWLLPPWLLLVHSFLIIATIFSALARLLSIFVVLRSPLTVVLRFGYQMVMALSLLELASSLLLGVTATVFGCCCWSRSWLLYPNYNHLSWGWVALLLAGLLHAVSGLLLLREARLERGRRDYNQQGWKFMI